MNPTISTEGLREVFRPERYDAADEVAMRRFREMASERGVLLHDSLAAQLQELVESRSPRKKPTAAEVAERIPEVTAGAPLSAWGTWVYYPWSRLAVHTLPERHFIELRSSRNRYRITPAEQARLDACSIGVVGLSVGQASAVTLVLEGIGRRFRLADGDTLSLSNMNRLRASLADIGLNKCVIAARQMFEIDPYLDVSIFTAGLHDGNVEEFLVGGGKIDVLVEECDDLFIKLLVRDRARAHGIMCIMDTNDRGMLDVERFDLEPSRPILHGLLGDVSPETVRGLSTYDKVPYLIRIIPPDTMSLRMRASLFEIDETIPGWPQLASGVALGGALVADVARRSLLGELSASGRFFVDLDTLIHPAAAAPLTPVSPAPEPPLPQVVAPPLVPASSPPSRADLRRIVEFGILAPSGGNIQPWRFTLRRGDILCDLDPERSRMLLDYGQNASLMAIGAAVENMTIAARAMGLSPSVEALHDAAKPDRVCRLSFQPAAAEVSPLFEEIPRRATNRRLGRRVPLTPAERDALLAAAVEAGSSLQIVDDERGLDAAARIIGSGDRVRFLSRKLHEEMIGELRWTPEEAARTADGIDIRTLELTRTDLAGMQLSARWDAMEMLVQIKGGSGLEKLTRKSIAAASAVALLTTPGTSRESYLRGGRGVQRVWLTASRLGLAFQPMSILPFLFARLERGGGEGLTEQDVQSLRSIRSAYRELFEIQPANAEVFLFRLAKASPPEVRAVRRPVDDVLTIDPD
jgi:hypothetical protein